MLEIPYHPRILEFLNTFPCKPGELPCCLCGKPIPEKKAKYWVHEHNGGGFLVTEEEASRLSPNADLGLQPVGANCWKANKSIHPYRITKDK